MPTPVSSITRKATRQPDEPLNILCMPTHERYETNLAQTGHNFYAYQILDGSIKKWNETFAPIPPNYTILKPHQLLPWVDVDLILCQEKQNQFPICYNITNGLQVPMINLEHTLPISSWDESIIGAYKKLKGHVNIFISEFSRRKWGWGGDEALVVHHGIDTNFFKPMELSKKPHVLSVVNDWINRDWCCGFNLWKQVTQGLTALPLGNTPGLSTGVTPPELVNHYNEAQVFLNTSLVSPIPTTLLEAMSCGAACVSTATCMIPEIIQNGHNGFISNEPSKLRDYTNLLLNNKELCIKLGMNARKTILEKFNLDRFVKDWNKIFYDTANMEQKW